MAIMNRDTLWKLTGCAQHYPWGGKSFIPELICLANDEKKPFAELWFGQHPACPSVTSGGTTLSDLIASAPETFFTRQEQESWDNELPFLCKILDVQEMLSIQIHPDKEQAREGFQREEQEEVNPDAFERTFRDRNHKPEIMYALSDFYLLHDFRGEEEILKDLIKNEPLNGVAKKIVASGLPEFYKWFMQLSQQQVNKILRPFADMIKETELTENPLDRDYWVKRALKKFCTPRHIDRGILSFYLMNLVFLRPGEVIFQDSGIPHAYLRGQNIEIMANSDNVIRGGLTSKHINSSALSQLVRFDERTVHYLHPEKVDESQVVFTPPVEEFQLSVIELEPYQEYAMKIRHISLLFSTCNCFMTRSDQQEMRVSGGEAVLVRAGESLVLQSRMEAKIFLVTTNV